jgi:pimeloyl-ACP methyl ester carboxylesterase
MRDLARCCFAAVFLLLPFCNFAHGAPTPSPQTVITCPSATQKIDEQSFVSIGGIEQWITISGIRCGNPVVLILHGGPGNTMSPFASNIYSAWEKEFTLVQWDQRGAGRTFGRNPGTAESELSIERMTQDGIDLAAYLVRYLNTKKIILVGGSWSSVLGVYMAKSRPDLFHAYVGTGQLVSGKENQEASVRKVLALARAADDAKTISTIEALGPPPWTNPRNFGILRRVTRVYEAKTSTPAPKSWWVPSPLYTTPEAEASYEGGEDYSYLQFVGLKGNGMLSKIDLPKLGLAFDIPVFLLQGSEDLVTVPEVAKRYFDSITAPQKEYVLLQNTGHDPNPVMIDAQYDVLKKRVVPLMK